MSSYNEDRVHFQNMAFVAWGVAVLVIVCTICNWNNIKLGIAVMKCTAAFIGSTP